MVKMQYTMLQQDNLLVIDGAYGFHSTRPHGPVLSSYGSVSYVCVYVCVSVCHTYHHTF